MKHLLLIFGLLLAAGTPALVRADTVENPYPFYYQFKLRYQSGHIELASPYDVATGMNAPITGAWHIALFDPNGTELGNWPMDPTANSNQPVVYIPYATDGTTARITDDRGSEALAIDVSVNRICNDDGQCDANYGEDSVACPHDCGSTALIQQAAPAAIGGHVDAQSVAGLILFRLGLGGAGLLLLFITFRTLDSRRQP